ncbi:hypothetical protein [Pseudoxanthomonas sp. CF125]|uniref:hypothetical protein n=1 Tax=Pseudoxanthomonas sp. CF125 TaxID=1855303 RepID=UPI000B8555C4|nr:hypothetical protein [Pseudoxanthomonas sp. CF125]
MDTVTAITGLACFLAICIGGIVVIFRPRLYRAAIWVLVISALFSLFVVAGPTKRAAVTIFEHNGGTYTNEMAKLYIAYISVNFMFYAVIAACVIVLGLIALRLSYSRGP